MKLHARFSAKKPEETNDVERLTITHGGFEIEISGVGGGLRIRLDRPLGTQLVVFPHASNMVSIHAAREDEIGCAK